MPSTGNAFTRHRNGNRHASKGRAEPESRNAALRVCRIRPGGAEGTAAWHTPEITRNNTESGIGCSPALGHGADRSFGRAFTAALFGVPGFAGIDNPRFLIGFVREKCAV